MTLRAVLEKLKYIQIKVKCRTAGTIYGAELVGQVGRRATVAHSGVG